MSELPTISKSNYETQLISFVSEVIVPMGFDVVDLDVLSSRANIRLFIDKTTPALSVSQEAESSEETTRWGITLGDCETVTRTLLPAIELEDWTPEEVTLEVSSPGLDRRLRTLSDFESSVGSDVKVTLTRPLDGFGRKIRGQLLCLKDQDLVFEVQKQSVTVKMCDVIKAVRIWDGKF